MDGKTVNRIIQKVIHPELYAAGFVRSTSRTFWRTAATRVEVLNFQSFNSYLARVLGCTTYSFGVNLGSFLPEIPPQYEMERIKEAEGKLWPQEYECHLRGHLLRGFSQPELRRRDIWFVDPHGKYLEKAIRDVRGSIIRQAFPWYEGLRDSERVLDILLHKPEDMRRLWGFGRNPSPLRSYMTGYVALALGRRDLGKQQLLKALDSGCFQSVSKRIARDIGLPGSRGNVRNDNKL